MQGFFRIFFGFPEIFPQNLPSTLTNHRFRLKPAVLFRPGRALLAKFLHYSGPVVLNETLWGLGTSLYKVIMGHMEGSTEILAARALAGKKTYDTWQQGFLQILQSLQKDKVFYINVYHSISREYIEQYLYKLTYDLMIGVVEERAAGMSVRAEDKEFIAHFYKYAFVGLTLEWIRGGMKEAPVAIVERVSTVTHGGITNALEACRIGD